MNAAIEQLDRICRHIETEWRLTDNDVTAFPDIVMKWTAGLDLSAFGDLANITALMAVPNIARMQEMTSFSDMYLMLWHNGRFHVEVLNWWGTDINVHDHNFSGVQCQLTGLSLNVLYDMPCEGRNSRLRRGAIGVRSAELWQPGDRSYVRPGGQDPHTVHHLSTPTVSLLFRTIPTPDFGPQLNYFPPSVAASYTVADTPFRIKASALRLLARGPAAQFHQVFREVIAGQTATENLFTIIKMTDLLFERAHVGLLHAFAEQGEQQRAIVEAAAFRRATLFLLETLKPLPGLEQDEVMALSILGAVFDSEGLDTVLSCLASAGHVIDFYGALARLHQRLAPAHRTELEKVVHLFELDELDRVLLDCADHELCDAR